uniref:tRNA(Ile)-lysidine synthase n=1 Tax=Solibacter usitatus (strain Ellin6076) TaxID=234267 RepID=TILS_SOLUE|nr:RecName: Full=tRNA(Ile)-lysidine synthase; AltName: Full=tRNA(Ile)-2-lysyl-cytidine synthase; AltName: Full=tRNA(Ile)-lysidine synthetase [Candidatus Solibacter usitatus Ellin6076]
MFASGARVAVGVSGGADSVCLLHALVELGGLKLSVLHVDHGLRGAESRADAEFVGELAARMGLPFCLREVTLGPGNVEQEGRRARLRFFHEQLAAGNCDRVALGHTRSDQAETVLFRFLRGSGTAGLAGIRPVTAEGIVRPLIELERAEIEEYLRERQIPWREDATNAGEEFARNRIRHGLLPQLAAEWNPALVETLAHTAEFARAEEAYWAGEIDRLSAESLTAGDGCVLIRTESLKALSLAVARRLVRRAIQMAKGDLRGVDFGHVERVVELASAPTGRGRTQVPGLDVRRSFEWLRLGVPFTRKPYSLKPLVPGTTQIPGTRNGISLELIEKSETSVLPWNVYNTEMGCLDWKRLAGSLELRNWRFGDQYQPMGLTGSEKIKTLFQLQRIPVWERAQWPVLTDGESIVWTRRFGPAAGFAAGPESGVVLKLGEVTIR